ncbi:MFS transporter [Oceanomicrobium pacificus]|uniref:MFS transporter n=1 Tax=Oceanomicrobium pacificus TaxID=2692916 RepID=A0A6B0U2A5_9RHOB|nr:MFS transporter [Oceanomicrobium pacificus]MXU65161.1 MFS transporter [Oceanomicrobium pacificus]
MLAAPRNSRGARAPAPDVTWRRPALLDTTFAPFRNRTYFAFWSAVLVSNFGGLIQMVGAGWLMTSLTDSPSMVALVQASNTLPMMVFMLFAGAAADMFDRRKVMLTAQIFMFTISALLLGFAAAGLLSPWTLLLFTFLIGSGNALNNPSWQASMGDIFPREELPAAVAMNAMGFNMTRSVAPAIGGVIVAAFGAVAAFAVNTFSYLFIITFLFRWKREVEPRALDREQLTRAISAGIRYALMSPNIYRVGLRGFLFGVTAVAMLALLPLVVRFKLGQTADVYGLMLGAFGVGAVAGALTSVSLREALRNEYIVRGTFALNGLALVTMGLADTVWMTGLCLMVSGACWVQTMSLLNVSVQLASPRWVVGRTLGMHQMGAFGGMALGSWLWGTVAEGASLDTALVCAGVLMLSAIAVGFLLPLPDFNTEDLAPLDRFREPELALGISGRSGPVRVQVTYRIAEADRITFLTLMAQRRRIRMRDGAQRWALLRDLQAPECWTESYQVPTWTEYLRHNQRRTRSDGPVADEIRALHRGDAPPEVHRWIERQPDPNMPDPPVRLHPEI